MRSSPADTTFRSRLKSALNPAPVWAETGRIGTSDMNRRPCAMSARTSARSIRLDEIPLVREHERGCSPCSRSNEATRASWSVMPSAASTISSATSARSRERSVISAPPCSPGPCRFPTLRMTRGIDENVVLALVRVIEMSMASRVVPGALEDDHPLILPGETIGRRALSDVRPPDDGDANRRFARDPSISSRSGEARAMTPGSIRAHRRRRRRVRPRPRRCLGDPEAMELVHPILMMLRLIDLVDEQSQWLACTPQRMGDRFVLGQQAELAIDHEEDHVRRLDGRACLGLNGGFQPLAVGPGRARPYPPSRSSRPSISIRSAIRSRVRPGLIRDERPAIAGITVEERRLADVRSADECDHREFDPDHFHHDAG